MSIISIAKTSGYDYETIEKSIELHFKTLELDKKIKPDMRVLIKPNLLMKRSPDEGTTTHPVIVKAIINKLKQLGVSDITVADSPGGPYTRQALHGIYAQTGYAELAKQLDFNLNDDFGFAPRSFEQGKACREFNLINPVHNADYIINVPKLKTHCMTTLSGAVKNLFGTVPGLQKPEMHFRFTDKEKFAQMLLDLCQTVKPNATIVDAVVSMEGDGPSGGELRNTGLTLASENPYELDVALCRLIDIGTKDVHTVRLSIENGLANESEIKISGDFDEIIPIREYKKPASKTIDFQSSVPVIVRPVAAYISEKYLSPKPKVELKKCIGCGKCAESCPAKVIKITNRKAQIDHKDCIKCYCCHEMCPVKAIEIKRSRLLKI